MEPYARLTGAITKGPSGGDIGAFFDLDGTIIATHSVRAVFAERLRAGQVSAGEIIDTLSMALNYRRKSADFVEIMARSIRNMRGMDEAAFIQLGEKIYRQRLAAQVFPELKAIVRAHQARGHTLAIISSASRYQIDALAGSLKIDHILCTQLEVKQGRFTGEITGQACYGAGKVCAARRFAEEQQLDLAKSYFYSNGSEDIPLMEAVGHPVAINPDKDLLTVATSRCWQMHRFSSRGSVGVGDIARTLVTFGSVLPALGAGLPLRAFGATRRDAINFSISTWASLASAIAGLRLIVAGEENLWARRPAVFIFNHQSAIDTLIIAKLLREDFVGIAKKEIQKQPFMGPALKAAGAVFIDREKGDDPKTVLQPAIDAIAQGKSVLLAPEGTRSQNEKLGAFKKGAFHLAMQARVPLVPIVIHNALDALPSKSMVVRPAEVKVTVLKPIATGRWSARTLARQVSRVRDLYLKALRQAAESRP